MINANNHQYETREIAGCNIKLFFTESENKEVKGYILNNLLDAFEKRNNICGDYII